MLLATLVLAALLPAACERSPAPQPTPGTVLPEARALHQVVAETRAILPRVPAGTDWPAPPPTPEPPAAREALAGSGRLLRPADFPHLPRRLDVAVYLDGRRPPGGHLLVTPEGGSAATWPVLSGQMHGERDGAFTLLLRVRDPAYRLRYFALAGLRYEEEGQAYRAFEGYLVYPDAAGELSTRGAVYPLDFGFRWPQPPAVVQQAELLGKLVADLHARYERLRELGAEVTDLRGAAESLREADVPPEQASERTADLAEYRERIAAAEDERAALREALWRDLADSYRRRAELAQAWLAFTATNAYHWRNPAARRGAYRPLADLRDAYARLTPLYDALGGDDKPALREARAAMEQAVLREAETAPPAP